MLAAGQHAAAAAQLQRAIALGHLRSRALNAWLLIEGREGIAMDMKAAVELVEEGARLGCHQCQGVLAYCYFTVCTSMVNGEPILIGNDDPRVLDLALASSEKGSRYGQYVLGELNDDDTQALAFFRLAAEQNLDRAQIRLGSNLYCNGFGPSADHAEALRWFQLAAAQGNPGALFYVGYMHERGEGVQADEAEAIRWYRRAAAAGHIQAAICLRTLGA